MHIHHAVPFGWRLAPRSPHWRRPARPEHLQDNEFREQFDYTTLIYDVFFSADRSCAICVCPPFFNLAEQMYQASFTVSTLAGGRASCRAYVLEHYNCTEIWIMLPENAGDLLTCYSALGKFETRIGQSGCGLLEGKNVLFGKQKDNRLDWIADWINLNQGLHGIDAVLLFDNQSSAYTREELTQYLALHTNVDLLCLVSWPYLFGPQGGGSRPELVARNNGEPLPWDSDFTDYAILQTGLWRWLHTAGHVIWGDVDELIVCEDNEALFDKVDAASGGVLPLAMGYVGDVRGLGDVLDQAMPAAKGSDFFRYPFVLVREAGGVKYAFSPAGLVRGDQIAVHGVYKHDGQRYETPVPGARVRHFKPITTGWKLPSRTAPPAAYDPELHRLDRDLVAALSRVAAANPRYSYPVRAIESFARDLGIFVP